LKPIFTCSIIYRLLPLELCEVSSEKLFLQDDDSKRCCRRMPHNENVLYQVATALEYIRKLGMDHCDNKPTKRPHLGGFEGWPSHDEMGRLWSLN
jgi:hypothetical protein